jgi:hypothetical protein
LKEEAVKKAILDKPPRVDIAQNLKAAVESGAKLGDVVRDMVKVYRGPGKLTPSEFMYYRLWDPKLSAADKLEFVGKVAQHKLHWSMTDATWTAVANDKVLFHLLCAGAGIPHPQMLAVVGGRGLIPGVQSIADPAILEHFLKDELNYPAFLKPTAGMYSLGTESLVRYVRPADEIEFVDGRRERPAETARRVLARKGGYVVQRTLEPNPEIVERFGVGLWSVRVLSLLDGGSAKIFRAVCKIPAAGNWADNFWRPGNMIAAVDVETGRIIRTVKGTGAAMEVDFNHPATGADLVGWRVPQWAEVFDLVRRGAGATWGMRTQSWDIALAAPGPVAIEMNFGGDLNLSQLAYGKGALDQVFSAHLGRKDV